MCHEIHDHNQHTGASSRHHNEHDDGPFSKFNEDLLCEKIFSFQQCVLLNFDTKRTGTLL